MELEELQKKIYRPGAEFDRRIKRSEDFELKPKNEETQERWQSAEKKRGRKWKRYLFGAIILALTVSFVIIGIMFWRGIDSFDKTKIKLEIFGPERIVSGDEADYIIKYKNETKTALKDLKLIFNYPDKSLPLDDQDLIQNFNLPDIEPEQEAQVKLSVRIIGSKNDIKKAEARLNYQPINISSRFENQTEFITKIIAVPMILDFDLPKSLVSGQSFSFSLEYLNQAEISFDDIQIKLEYPLGFQFLSAEPYPDQRDNIWTTGNLMAKSQGKIFINGQLDGEENEIKSFKASLGQLQNEQFISYTETAEAIQLSKPSLYISQSVNEVADYIAEAGETLRYQIDYQNTSDLGIKGVIITSKIEGPALDIASIKSEGGSFDENNQTITWKASNKPDLVFLGPRQKGQIKFSVNIRNPLPIYNYNDKNFIITNRVKINSQDAPLSLGHLQIGSQSELITKINSQLTIQAKGYFQDDLIPNNGPIPPKIGATTTYTIKWQLSNTSNDLKDVEVRAYLPPHVQWTDKIKPEDADLKFQPQTGELTWLVGNLPSTTGLLLPTKQVAFQVSITPNIIHLGDLMELIGQSKATAQDSFTEKLLTFTDKPIDTDLPDDFTIERKEGQVVE